MTEPPDWVIRPARANFSIHQIPARGFQTEGPLQNQLDPALAWSRNLAGKDGLANGKTPVSGNNIFGPVKTNNLAVTPATSVAVSPTNMLVSNNFTSSDTMVSWAHWSWDGEDGNVVLGCAKVVCDGHQDELVSNEIPVLAGETIQISCQVKWDDLAYTGADPIVLGVEKYRKGREAGTNAIMYLDIGGFGVDSVSAPGASADWTELAGTYVVDPGVDQLRFLFKPRQSITAGTIRWDEANFLKLDLIDDNAVPGVGETVDDIVRRLYGVEGEGFTHNDSAIALANTAAALVSVTSRLSALEAQGSAGSIAGDDFLWTGEITDSANWGGGYSQDIGICGFYSANSADAQWNASGFTPGDTTQECWFDWQGTDAVSDTDYQLIQTVLSSAPYTSAGYRAWTYLHGRVSSDWSKYIRAGICSDGTYFVGYQFSGSFTVMNSGTCDVPGAGSILSLYCGDLATTATRHFKLTVGSSVVADFDEVGTNSQLGATNRKWGWGGKAEGGLFFAFITFLPTQAVPPKINQWIAVDQ